MGKLQTYIICTVALLLSYSCSTEEIKWYYPDQIPVEPEFFIEDFQSIHEIVASECSMYRIDIDSLYSTSLQRIKNAKTKLEYSHALLRYFTGLKCGHANPLFSSYYIPQSIAYVDGRIFIKEIETKWLYENGNILAGDEIIGVNGKALQDWMTSQLEITPGPTRAFREMQVANSILASPFDATLVINVLREDTEIEVSLEPSKFYTNANEWANINKKVTSEIKNDSIGIIRINKMDMDETNEAFDSCYSSLCKLPYLIIDIRRNGGGDSRVSEYICQYLIGVPLKDCVSNREITPAPNHFKGKIYLLTSPSTFSAAESFAINLRESGNVTIVGEPTGGDTGNGPHNYVSKHGIAFRIPTRVPKKSPKGFPLGGIGLPVDHEIRQSISDIKKGIDTQMEFIVEKITNEL